MCSSYECPTLTGGDTYSRGTQWSAEENAPFRLYVVGDQGKANNNQYMVADALFKRHQNMPFHFGISTGDNFYAFKDSADEEYDGVRSYTSNKFTKALHWPYRRLPPLALTFGNHDKYRGSETIDPSLKAGRDCNKYHTQADYNWGVFAGEEYRYGSLTDTAFDVDSVEPSLPGPRVKVPAFVKVFFLDSNPIYEQPDTARAEAAVFEAGRRMAHFFNLPAPGESVPAAKVWHIVVSHAFFYMPGDHHGKAPTLLRSRVPGFLGKLGKHQLNIMIRKVEALMAANTVDLMVTGHEHIGAFASRYTGSTVLHNLQVGNSGGSLDAGIYAPPMPSIVEKGFANGYPIVHPQFNQKNFGFAEISLGPEEISIATFSVGKKKPHTVIPVGSYNAHYTLHHDDDVVFNKLASAYRQYIPNSNVDGQLRFLRDEGLFDRPVELIDQPAVQAENLGENLDQLLNEDEDLRNEFAAFSSKNPGGNFDDFRRESMTRQDSVSY